MEFPIVFLPGLSFTSGGYRDDFKYHREDGKLVVDLKKSASEKAKEKEIWRKSRRMLESSMSALTRAASRCYVYHAPIKIFSNARVPAQVRMMRSWGAEEKDSDKKENSWRRKLRYGSMNLEVQQSTRVFA